MTDASSGSSLFRKRARVTDYSPPVNNPSITDAILDSSSRPSTAVRTSESPSKPLHRRESSLSSLSEIGSTIRRRSTSLRSRRAKSPTFWENLVYTTHTEKRSTSAMVKPQLAVSTLSSHPSSESVATMDRSASRLPTSAIDAKLPRAQTFGQGMRREDSSLRPATSMGMSNGGTRSVSSNGPSQDLRSSIKRIHDMATKRISLLRYFRMVYASETHWFNTYRFTPAQIRSLPSMLPMRLARRTQSLLILGLSLPFVLDPNCESLIDYLRAFYSLLSEYESYTTLHPPEGSSSSALSRARIPQMFKRGPTKGRRGSSAEGLLTSPQGAHDDPRSAGVGGIGGGASATWTSFPAVTQEHDLLAGEEYHFLLTPSLPFDADYFETFATLCEVLSDSYQHVTTTLEKQEADFMAGDPGGIAGGMSGVAELFAKVDHKVKKIILAGLVKEFEDASRQSIRSEIAGVGKLVLGGLV